jgi:hypothetical protein
MMTTVDPNYLPPGPRFTASLSFALQRQLNERLARAARTTDVGTSLPALHSRVDWFMVRDDGTDEVEVPTSDCT